MLDMKNNSTACDPSIHNITNFLASSVHDMKNSLNMLIYSLEKALASAEITQLPAHTELMQVNHEAKRINNNLVQLLTLYKLGQKIYPFDPQNICLDDFLHTITAQYIGLLKSQGISLEVHVDSGLYWYFDEDLISNVVGNALNNAMRYARDRIHIIADKKEGKLELRIEDNGDGYPVQILQESNNSMHSVDFQGGHTGLGFYFAKMVARMHHNQGCAGELKLKNGASLKGACFVLILP
jgi:signal transduction histidine kinase